MGRNLKTNKDILLVIVGIDGSKDENPEVQKIAWKRG